MLLIGSLFSSSNTLWTFIITLVYALFLFHMIWFLIVIDFLCLSYKVAINEFSIFIHCQLYVLILFQPYFTLALFLLLEVPQLLQKLIIQYLLSRRSLSWIVFKHSHQKSSQLQIFNLLKILTCWLLLYTKMT